MNFVDGSASPIILLLSSIFFFGVCCVLHTHIDFGSTTDEDNNNITDIKQDEYLKNAWFMVIAKTFAMLSIT
jgi:hypothetical protein